MFAEIRCGTFLALLVLNWEWDRNTAAKVGGNIRIMHGYWCFRMFPKIRASVLLGPSDKDYMGALIYGNTHTRFLVIV